MESEKVKEIKKGLKFMMGFVISNKLPYIDGNTPKQIAYEEIFNYINGLESENKELNNELKRYKMDWLNSEKMHLQADMEDTEFELFCANKSLEEVRAENKQLKDRIADLENIGLNEEMTVGEYLRELERLKKDNELLRNAKVVYETVDYCYEDLKKAQDRIAELEKEIEENAFYSKGYAQGIKNTYEVVIPDKLKQFAERLKEKGKKASYIRKDNQFDLLEYFDDIDETLKEFIE